MQIAPAQDIELCRRKLQCENARSVGRGPVALLQKYGIDRVTGQIGRLSEVLELFSLNREQPPPETMDSFLTRYCFWDSGVEAEELQDSTLSTLSLFP